MRSILLYGASVGAMLAAIPAYAQTAAPVPDGGSGIADIVVTAQKRAENVENTALSIAVLTGADLQARGETQLDTSLRNTASLQVQGTPQGGAVYIRGVGSNGDSNYIDPSVSVNIDGVYSGRSERLSAPLYDLDRIEVLRGPQGTLYGRNADGGGVNIVTNDPLLGKWETRGNAQFGNYNLRHFDGAQNVPVSDTLAFRVAALREDRDGYFSNDGYASHVFGIRFKALYEPTDELHIHALVDYSHQDGHLATSVPVAGDLPSPPFPAGGWPTDPNNAWYVDPYHPADTIDFKFLTTAIQVDYRSKIGTFTLLPTYTHSSRYFDTNLVVGTYFGPLTPSITKEDQYTLEARLASPDNSRLKWILGFYYLWSNNSMPAGIGTTQSATLADGNNVDLFTSYTAGAPPTTSIAGYGQLTYPITDRFRVTGGLRYTADRKSQAVQIVSNYVPGYDSGTLVSSSRYSAVTYKAGVEYDVAPRSLAYAQITRGYKAGGYDTTAVPPKAYEPEFVTAYEVGSKNRFWSNRLQVNASLYYYKYQDIQVQFNPAVSPPLPIPVAYIPAGASYGYFQQYVVNGGAGVNKGAELEVLATPTRHDTISFSATYTDAHYGTFSDPNLAGLAGEVMAATPKRTIFASYAHTWDVGPAGKLTLQADTKASSSYYSSVSNRGSRPASFQGAYTRSDASLVFDSGSFWTVSLWVKNLENQAQIQFGDFPLNRNVISFPRTFGGNLAVKF